MLSRYPTSEDSPCRNLTLLSNCPLSGLKEPIWWSPLVDKDLRRSPLRGPLTSSGEMDQLHGWERRRCPRWSQSWCLLGSGVTAATMGSVHSPCWERLVGRRVLADSYLSVCQARAQGLSVS